MWICEYARNGGELLQYTFCVLYFKSSHFLNYVIFHGALWDIVVRETLLWGRHCCEGDIVVRETLLLGRHCCEGDIVVRDTLLWGRHCCEGDIVEPRNLNVDDNSIKIRSCYQEMLRYRNGTVYGVYTSLRYWIGDVSASILQGDSVGKVSSFGVESNWPLWEKEFIFTHVSASILQGDSVGNGNSYIYICISQYSTGWFSRKGQ